MKATELMIGDWVNSDFGIFQIKEIFDDAVRDNRGNDYKFDCIHPILLTAEILKNNGFELSEGRELIALVGLMFECKIMSQTLHLYYDKRNKDYSLYAFGSQINHILYVHELQNAMRVCGIKKEIEL